MSKHDTQRITTDDGARYDVAAPRARRIATVIIVVLLAMGAWVIAQRVMPHAFGGQSGVVTMASPQAVAADDVSVDGAETMPRRIVSMVTKSALRTPDGVANEMADVSAQEEVPAADRKIRKTGHLAIVVDDVTVTVDRVRTVARRYGGEVMQTRFRKDKRDRMRGTMSLRVRARDFDAAFDDIKKNVATVVKSENVTTYDVTEEYTDLRARLDNKHREEAAFAAILERADKMDDIIKATRELSRVRGEIERLEGRLRYMDSRTTFSYITLQIEEDEKVVTPEAGWRPGAVAKQSLNRLIADAQDMVDNAIRFLVWFTPLFLAYVVVIVVLWRVGLRFARAAWRWWQRRSGNTNK